MSGGPNKRATKQHKLPVLAMAGALLLGLPTASLAVVGFSQNSASGASSALDIFTPASVDPELAARVAKKAGEKGIRFTPAGSNPVLRDRTVTVAVRIDDETAKAVSVRNAIDAAPGVGTSLSALQPSKFNLGTARGYQSFARPIELPSNVKNLSVPDLSEFAPAKPRAEDKPSRLQPRIELEDRAIAGRSPNTLDASESSVDVGGSFRLSKNLDVTAGVRYSQERDRLDPLTDSVQDSQAVYVGTQIRF
ncbi:hypothetical protein ACI5KX_00960 [Erythrobacter sp. GH1-10]|uniref:hypothetical protein n=1 Tax=Erythrobacter sp. GH1-10 TaxID=3349334 RepID=UPI003877F87E